MKRQGTPALGIEGLRRLVGRNKPTFATVTIGALVALSAGGCGIAAPSSEGVGQVNQATGTQQICISSGACYSYGPGSPINLYVAPAPRGSNSWTGAISASDGTDGPLATFEGARRIVQELVAALTSAGISTGISVQFQGGTYYLLQDPLLAANFNLPGGPYGEILTAVDSGSSSIPITYEAYQNDQPIFSGGLPVSGLPNSVWSNPSKDGKTWKVTLPQNVGAAGATIPIQPFENIFYDVQSSGTPFGQRRLRPRVGGVVTGSPADSLTSYLRIAAPVLTGGSPQDPNASGCPLTSAQCVDRFYYRASDLGSQNWAGYDCGSTTPPPPDPVELVTFELWTAAKQQVKCIDQTQNVIYLTGPIWQDAGSLPNAYGYTQNHRYFVENLKSALSQPGQWFVDQSASSWVLTYLSQENENPPADTVVIPQLKQVLVASGLQNVTFKGLNFAHDDYIVPTGGFNNTTEAPAAVSFQNATGILFDSGSVSQTSGTGLEFISCIAQGAIDSTSGVYVGSPQWCHRSFGGNTGSNIVQNSAFWDLGSHGIRIGDDAAPTDSTTNVAQSNKVQNNVISGYGRVFPDSNGINQGTGDGNTYQTNKIFDGYKAAIRVRYVSYQPDKKPVFPTGNSIQYNLVYNLFQGIMNDGGSLYFGVGNSSGTGTGNSIAYNVVHDVTDSSILDADGYGGDGLYADEWSGDVSMTYNLVYRVSGSAVTFAGPHPFSGDGISAITNNVFAYARTSMIGAGNPYNPTSNPPVAPPAAQFFDAWDNIFYFDRDAYSSNPCVFSLPCEDINPKLVPPPNPNPFYVQGGMAYPGSVPNSPLVLVPYTGFENWYSNTYFRRPNKTYGVTGGLASDGSAFHTENPVVNSKCASNTSDCVAMTIAQATAAGVWPAAAPTWNLYSFAGWQGLGEDPGSAVADPQFKNPTWPADDYSFPNGAPSGFTKWTYPQGASGGVVPPFPVLPGFPTATYDPAVDF
jgi:hypothetical protein